MNQVQRLNNIRNKISGFGSKIQEKKEITEEQIIIIHDILMVEYGWIPFEEFKLLPLSTLWNLLWAINNRKESEKKEIEKSKRKNGRRN